MSHAFIPSSHHRAQVRVVDSVDSGKSTYHSHSFAASRHHVCSRSVRKHAALKCSPAIKESSFLLLAQGNGTAGRVLELYTASGVRSETSRRRTDGRTDGLISKTLSTRQPRLRARSCSGSHSWRGAPSSNSACLAPVLLRR